MTEQFPFLTQEYFSNTVLAYLIAAVSFVGSIAVLFVFDKVLMSILKRWAKKTTVWFDDFLVNAIDKMLLPILYIGAFYFSVKQLILNPSVDKLITTVAIALVVFQGTRLMVAVVSKFMQEFWMKKAEASGNYTTAKTLVTVLKVVIWGVAIVFLLDNLGFNVSAIVAGLGIGGVAVALAAQTILGDLFNYFVIFFDRPFEEGDFIIIGDYLGVIEHIGIKSTRIRSLGGEQIVFSNSDLTGSRVRNYKRMQQRRVLFKLGVIYQTSAEKMKKIPGIIKEIIEKIENTRFDRAHFQGFGDFSLNLETVYYVLSADYNVYMDTQQKINLAIQEAFAKEGIEFAYPTQSLFVEKVAMAGSAT